FIPDITEYGQILIGPFLSVPMHSEPYKNKLFKCHLVETKPSDHHDRQGNNQDDPAEQIFAHISPAKKIKRHTDNNGQEGSNGLSKRHVEEIFCFVIFDFFWNPHFNQRKSLPYMVPTTCFAHVPDFIIVRAKTMESMMKIKMFVFPV